MELTLADGRTLEHMVFGDPRGEPVVVFHGTPATAYAGALVSDAAVAARARLVAVSRPGYGASSTSPPGLASTASDVVELLDALGLDRVGVHGISGGGPFALAMAAVAPERVTRVVVSAGPSAEAEADQPGEAEAQFGGAAEQSLAEFRARAFPSGPPPGSYLARHPDKFEVFVANLHRAVQRLDGYVRDNASWCGPWDIELADVTRPVRLVYGREDVMVPATHGEWLHARLPHAELSIRDGGHGDITFGLAGEAYEYLVGG